MLLSTRKAGIADKVTPKNMEHILMDNNKVHQSSFISDDLPKQFFCFKRRH